jgi:hypothetical protein
VQEYPEGVAQRVSSGGGYEPLWSTDGSELFYWQRNALMAVAVETGTEFSFASPRELFTGSYLQNPLPTYRTYDVARDGRFLVILAAGETGAAASASIVVVQNFGEELKRLVPTQ